MFTNVINGAFESTSTVAEGVILTETFFRLAKREAVKRCVDKKAAEIQHLFITQVMKTRSEFDTSRLNPPLRMQEPQFAGIILIPLVYLPLYIYPYIFLTGFQRSYPTLSPYQHTH